MGSTIVFVVLLVIVSALVCIKEKKVNAKTVIPVVVSVVLIIAATFISVDYMNGEQVRDASIVVDDRMIVHSKHNRLPIKFSDSENNEYWITGRLERYSYSGNLS